ncbi:hypothetical protein B9Z65_5214 [Elsinoe australis]|uniref:Uncharacterized protein n=1 Tax=Elsinoe australis TaxID=40998 RepID=A0A2P7ZDE6_9PEZI|nr:hypothetical protein B9Z65_5214 [Elsinoe australis]
MLKLLPLTAFLACTLATSLQIRQTPFKPFSSIEYQQLLDTEYPKSYVTYATSIRQHVPGRIDEYMVKFANRDWLCQWGDTKAEQIQCPTRNSVERYNTTSWTLIKEQAFYSTAYEDFGVPKQWLTQQDKVETVYVEAGAPGCPDGGVCQLIWKDYPTSIPDISVIDPKSTFEAAVSSHGTLGETLETIFERIRLGALPGDFRNVTTSFALPVLMLKEAVRSLKRVVQPSGASDYYRRRDVILSMGKAVLLTVPILSKSSAIEGMAGIDEVFRLALPLTQTLWGGYRAIANVGGPDTIYKQFDLLIGGQGSETFDEAALNVARMQLWEREGLRSLLGDDKG